MNHEWANVRTVAATASDQRSSYSWSIKEKFTTRPLNRSKLALSKNVIRMFKYRKNKDVTSVPDNASIDNGAGFVSFITNKWISRSHRVYIICALFLEVFHLGIHCFSPIYIARLQGSVITCLSNFLSMKIRLHSCKWLVPCSRHIRRSHFL